MGARPNRQWGSGAGDVPVSQIANHRIIPTPVIKAAGKTFKERMQIGFEPTSGNLKIHYTTDGGEPGGNSTVFTRPFFIDRTTTVKARAIESKGRSLVVAGTFHKIPQNWTIKLLSKYSRQYTGGGDLAVIDGVRGTSNFADGTWQGFDGQDLVAVVDLGGPRDVSKLGAGFLQDVESWIWMPRRVDFELSTDGTNFVPALSLTNDVSDSDYGALVKDFVGNIKPQRARFVRMTARNYGKLPAWHPGAGGDSWIFVDEIIIE